MKRFTRRYCRILENKTNNKKNLLALVGMPGGGKTEATLYLSKKGIPFVRFGDVTDETLKSLGQSLTQENERRFRENLRKELGMAAYAIKMKPKIEELLNQHDVLVIDGLYSWAEYLFLKKEFPSLILINIFAEPFRRYDRLYKRPIRPLSFAEARERDIAEIDKLDKGGPIAIADYLIENNGDDLPSFFQKIDSVLSRIGVSYSK